jgi:hypothetical protein
MGSKRVQVCIAALACGALAAGCETTKELGSAVGAGAMQGFYNRIFDSPGYGDDGSAPTTVSGSDSGWGEAWSPSGRGVGVAPRGTDAPATRACGDVGDEFALYAGDTLSAVQLAVPTQSGTLTRAQFAELAASGTRLTGPRAGGVLAVAATSEGNAAKFVVQWAKGKHPQLVTVEVSDATGKPVRSADAVPFQPRMALDLDSPTAGGAFDLIYGPAPETHELTLAAAKGASISFVNGSLCGE